MNTIFKYGLLLMGAYFAINWMADNPGKIDLFRHNVNNVVAVSADAASEIANEVGSQ